MWPLVVVMMGLSTIALAVAGNRSASTAVTGAEAEDPGSPAAASAIMAREMIVRSLKALEYNATNPSYSGIISDANLVMPTWFQGVATYATIANSNIIYTYAVTLPPGVSQEQVAGSLLIASGHSNATGLTRGGRIINGRFGDLGFTVPAGIVPDGVAVRVTKVR